MGQKKGGEKLWSADSIGEVLRSSQVKEQRIEVKEELLGDQDGPINSKDALPGERGVVYTADRDQR